MKKICPNNRAHNRFTTMAHVAQDWTVDGDGEFMGDAIDLEIDHGPNVDNIWTCNECGAEAVNAPPLPKLKKYDKVIVISEEGDHLLPIGTRGVVVNDAYSEGVHIVTTDNGSVVAILEEALQLQSSNDVPTGMLTFITGELAKIYCKLDELAVRVKILEEGKPLSAVLGDLVKGTRQR